MVEAGDEVAHSSQETPAAFRQRLIETLPHLRAFARGLCGRHDYADDLAQEAAVKAWAARDRFIPGTSIRAWTFTILRNHYLSEMRKSWRMTELEDGTAERILVINAAQEDTVHLSDMETALQQLSPERREALLLVGAGGFTYEEAAQICDTAIGTIKSRVARGRSDLLRLLGEEPGPTGDDP